ncbi:MAG: phytanoyl-CoA dioxygenase family protein [Armatimonadota bacterium]
MSLSVVDPAAAVLSCEQVEQFLRFGYVVLHDCFPRELAEAWTARAMARLGCRADDPATWPASRIHMPGVERRDLREFSPRLWRAACELLGGEERVRPCHVSDGFIINFRLGAGRPWRAPAPDAAAWHKDGDYFRHFLDSPEAGLLTLMLWSDLQPKGGGTFLARDSVPVVARYLAERPEGVRPARLEVRRLMAECRDFVEVTGRVGDVVLMHPFMLHAASPNHSGRPRFLTNPPLALKRPMSFRRARSRYSPVEAAVLRGLGVEALDFTPTGPRERITPARVRNQRKLLAAERSRR